MLESAAVRTRVRERFTDWTLLVGCGLDGLILGNILPKEFISRDDDIIVKVNNSKRMYNKIEVFFSDKQSVYAA